MSMPDKRVGPFVGVSRDEIMTLMDGRKYRVVLYCAYSAHGLIGTEFNGVAVLDEQRKQVLLDSHFQIDTGYFGATPSQEAEHARIMDMTDSEFVAFVNNHSRRRYTIAAAKP